MDESGSSCNQLNHARPQLLQPWPPPTNLLKLYDLLEMGMGYIPAIANKGAVNNLCHSVTVVVVRNVPNICCKVWTYLIYYQNGCVKLEDMYTNHQWLVNCLGVDASFLRHNIELKQWLFTFDFSAQI